MRFHLAVPLLASFTAAAIPSAAPLIPQATGATQNMRAPKLTLQQIARASRPSGGHRMLYTSKRALR